MSLTDQCRFPHQVIIDSAYAGNGFGGYPDALPLFVGVFRDIADSAVLAEGKNGRDHDMACLHNSFLVVAINPE